MKRTVIALALASALCACKDQDPSVTTLMQARSVVEKMRFVRHPQARDLCIGYVYVGVGFGAAETGGPATISVDCAKVEHLLEPPPSPPAAPH